MEHKIKETMDITRYTREGLEASVQPYLECGWETFTGVDESVITNEAGKSTVTYTRTLVKYEKEEGA